MAAPVFRWSPAGDADSGVTTYRLVVDGATSATVGASTTASRGRARPWARGRTPGASWRWTPRATPARSETRTLVVDRTAPGVAAPAAPAAAARVTGPAVRLRWTAATDANGVAGYRVMVDGSAAASVTAAETSALVRLTPGRHSWQVVATDAAGNASTSPARALVVTAAAAGAGARGRLVARPSGRPCGPACARACG